MLEEPSADANRSIRIPMTDHGSLDLQDLRLGLLRAITIAMVMMAVQAVAAAPSPLILLTSLEKKIQRNNKRLISFYYISSRIKLCIQKETRDYPNKRFKIRAKFNAI